ncbi:pre-mRNA splicing factor prp17 [Culex quinquefasciatus]|uniref:Pre-mRNA splicing factor prp17 n=1 Tax=Culex quinquefasciatus TaxID=7176 RepID=B0XJE7_CULQU|nr:pre-mRNA splicing factor prp17 [Culex quinquefasciatus]|eukprot:XP_001869769.1 pre-mRNA splicing factor prp17 [Culex quinquefasciatus]
MKNDKPENVDGCLGPWSKFDMDARIKILEVYNDRRCLRTYWDHQQAGRRYNKQQLRRSFARWDTRSGDIVQEYDHHLGATDSNSRSLILEFLLLHTDTNGHPDASNGDPVLILDHRENITNSLPAPLAVLAEFNKGCNFMLDIPKLRPPLLSKLDDDPSWLQNRTNPG